MSGGSIVGCRADEYGGGVYLEEDGNFTLEKGSIMGCRAGKYGGGVFCRIEDNLDCLCTYLPDQNALDFHIGDKVIIVIRKYNYEKKLIYGRILSRW